MKEEFDKMKQYKEIIEYISTQMSRFISSLQTIELLIANDESGEKHMKELMDSAYKRILELLLGLADSVKKNLHSPLITHDQIEALKEKYIGNE